MISSSYEGLRVVRRGYALKRVATSSFGWFRLLTTVATRRYV